MVECLLLGDKALQKRVGNEKKTGQIAKIDRRIIGTDYEGANGCQ